MPKFCIDDNLPIGTAYKTRSGKKAIYGGINVIKGYMFSVGSDSYYTDSQGNYNHRNTGLRLLIVMRPWKND